SRRERCPARSPTTASGSPRPGWSSANGAGARCGCRAPGAATICWNCSRTERRPEPGVAFGSRRRMGQDWDMSPADFTRPGSLYGAVDLGARKQALEAQARREAAAQDPAGGAGNPSVVDVTDATFNTEVVERSMRVPVLLDLWATWCGPCKQLSPILEKLAAEAAGKWVLAKVDVDANPQIAQALRVQSIPTVLAIFQGQPVTGFQGALPEAQVRQWLDQLMQALAQYLPKDAGQPQE